MNREDVLVWCVAPSLELPRSTENRRSDRVQESEQKEYLETEGVTEGAQQTWKERLGEAKQNTRIKIKSDQHQLKPTTPEEVEREKNPSQTPKRHTPRRKEERQRQNAIPLGSRNEEHAITPKLQNKTTPDTPGL
ncbi:hypothetical protein IMZ48_27865 [Candidatus Bathyarchaeota archaeon]|nr:hypothetical protein [Candidatus Bathyarchaeota archaeon]